MGNSTEFAQIRSNWIARTFVLPLPRSKYHRRQFYRQATLMTHLSLTFVELGLRF